MSALTYSICTDPTCKPMEWCFDTCLKKYSLFTTVLWDSRIKLLATKVRWFEGLSLRWQLQSWDIKYGAPDMLFPGRNWQLGTPLKCILAHLVLSHEPFSFLHALLFFFSFSSLHLNNVNLVSAPSDAIQKSVPWTALNDQEFELMFYSLPLMKKSQARQDVFSWQWALLTWGQDWCKEIEIALLT